MVRNWACVCVLDSLAPEGQQSITFTHTIKWSYQLSHTTGRWYTYILRGLVSHSIIYHWWRISLESFINGVHYSCTTTHQYRSMSGQESRTLSIVGILQSWCCTNHPKVAASGIPCLRNSQVWRKTDVGGDQKLEILLPWPCVVFYIVIIGRTKTA